MSALAGVTGIGRDMGDGAFANVRQLRPRRGSARAAGSVCTEQPLRCVWSGSADVFCCHSTVPEAVVKKAWRAELEAGGEREDRFFHFIWQGGVWLAYGLRNGRVRGVYCPSHNSERAERSHAALCADGDDVIDMPLAA
jgi:hypothetical protein